MDSARSRHLIFCFALILFIFASPIGGLGKPYNESESSESLEEELQAFLAPGHPPPHDPAEWLRLASIYLDLGYGFYVDREKKLSAFQEGARWAKQALEQQASSAEAHFLYAGNLGQAVQLQGVFAAALALSDLRFHVNRALELDESHAPAHHILGRMYEELPWFLGGDTQMAGRYLKKAIALDAYYVPARLDLGRWYLSHGRVEEAAKEFLGVLNTPPLKKRWIWERIHRPKAQRLLQQMRGGNLPVLPSERKLPP